MAKKRKTLPKDFEKILNSGDIEEMKGVFDKCELDAYGDYSKKTALAFEKCPDALTDWLIAKGANIHAHNEYKETPLHSRVNSWHSNIKILIDHGADVNNNDPRCGTPLHLAADRKNIDHVKTLLECGADVKLVNKEKLTALEYSLERCANTHIIDMAEVSKLLLDAGANVTPKMKTFVTAIGEHYEFYRPEKMDDKMEKYDDALSTLYALFDVMPAPRKIVHDDQSPIVIKESTWQKQHEELWTLLVPPRGVAKSLQGELIRISGKIANEIAGNGSINWDTEYVKMVDFFYDNVLSENALSASEQEGLEDLIKDIKKGYGDVNRIAELAVLWVAKNLQPIQMKAPPYDR